MTLAVKRKFSFLSGGVDHNTFTVVSFEGFEALSKPYQFEILLVTDNPSVDVEKLMQFSAQFIIHRQGDDDVIFNGVLAEFEEQRQYNKFFFYRALLVPRLWWLTLTHGNQVFVDKNVLEILQKVLEDCELHPKIHFKFLHRTVYEQLKHVCQYDETHFDFLSRWAEREGIYYFFEQAASQEQIVFIDEYDLHTDLSPQAALKYAPVSSRDYKNAEIIRALTCRQRLLPNSVFLKDYDYEHPNVAIEGKAEVDANGRGLKYVYGENFQTVAEGTRLAKLRAQEIFCKKKEYFCESSVPYISPGFLFQLSGHYRSEFNRKYLITEVTHSGHQTGYLVSGLGGAFSPHDMEMEYRNNFKAIPSDVQFRPELVTPKPQITGTMHATIDAAQGIGKFLYPVLDNKGRYKIRLPFDVENSVDGKASKLVRMMQPYAGELEGMHFPLDKGTEVLVSYIDGNPDRPIIAGAVPNFETVSPVTELNPRQHILQTKGGNKIILDDKPGNENIRIHSDGDLWFEAHNGYGNYIVGLPDDYMGSSNIKAMVDDLQAFTTSGLKVHNSQQGDWSTGEQPGDDIPIANTQTRAQIKLSRRDTFNMQYGNIYDYGGYWVYNLGNSYEESHLNQNAAINSHPTYDLLGQPGPDWCLPDPNGPAPDPANSSTTDYMWRSVATGEQGGTKNRLRDTSDPDWNIAHSSSNNWTNIWVDKKFGDSYEYREGNSIVVSKSNTVQEVKIGGKAIEEKFSSSTGKKTYYMKSGGGHKTEKKWSYVTGTLLSHYEGQLGINGEDYAHTSFTFNANSNASFTFAPHSHVSVVTATKATCDVTVAASAGLNISLAAKLNVSITAGIEVDVKLNPASVGIKIEFGTSAFVGLRGWAGGTNTFDVTTKKWDGKFQSVQAQKKAALDAADAKVALQNIKTNINFIKMAIDMHEVAMNKANVSINTGLTLMGM